MFKFLYAIYGIVVVIISTAVNLAYLDRSTSRSGSWWSSGGGGSSYGGYTGSGSTGGGHHK